MQLIPTPELLDPDRMLVNDRGNFTADHQARSALLDHALRESCAYAQQLWNELNTVRQYLLTSLPPDPHIPGPHHSATVSPSGPADENGWHNWIDAFAGVTSVLCGPHGDSGFGLSRAHEEARLRRDQPADSTQRSRT